MARPARAPAEPTREEIDAHNVHHEPYRSWCPACVAGRGVDDRHRPEDHAEDALSTIGLDYGYLTAVQDAAPIVFGKDSKQRWYISEMVPAKGVQSPWSPRHLAKVLGATGHKRCIMRTDGEPPIVALKQEVARLLKDSHGMEVVPERPGAGDSKSNGLAEHAVRECKAKVRTLRHALEQRIGMQIDAGHLVLAWLVRYAAASINRGRVGPDGKTAYQLRYGKPFRQTLPEFGECVQYLPAGKRQSRLEDRYKKGIFLGVEDGTNEYQIGTDIGVFPARAVRRYREDMRVDLELFNKLCGVPWNPRPHEEVLPEGAARVVVDRVPPVDPGAVPPQPRAAAAEPRQSGSRAVYIRRDVELLRYGYTDGCPGCTAAQLGGNPVSHSAACRARIEQAMAADAGAAPRLEEARARKRRASEEPGEEEEAHTDKALALPPEAPDTGGASSSAAGTAAPTAPPPAPQPRSTADVEMAADIAELSRALCGFGWAGSGVDLQEIFNPGNFKEMAPRFGLHAGMAFDLRTGWDLGTEDGRRLCWAHIEEEDPYFVIGSPMCCPFSVLQALNAGKRDPEKARALWDAGIAHLSFVLQVYRRQIEQGKKFLHEHPWGASSWKLEQVQALLSLPEVELRRGHQCVFGAVAVDDAGNEGPVAKATGWMGNCPEVLDEVAVLCPNELYKGAPEGAPHRHVALLGGGRPKRSERYPPRLVAAILRGLRRHLRKVRQEDGRHQTYMDALDTGITAEEPEAAAAVAAWKDDNPELLEEDPGGIDEVTGLPLPAELVRKSRKEEIAYCEQKLQIWDVVDVDMCWRETGRAPLGTRWTELNKGDDEHMEVRSRLVAQETKRQSTIEPGDTAAVFAAAPPLETLRFLGSMAMTADPNKKWVLRFLDVSRAHLHCKMRRRVFVRLPPEATHGGDETKCGLLNNCLYGLRDAGQNFEFDVRDVCVNAGCKQGVFSPVCYSVVGRELAFFHHGDDFVALGPREQSAWLSDELGRVFIIKDRGVLGPGAQDLREIRVLNRLMRWFPAGSPGGERIEYEADPRHVQILLAQTGLQEGKAKTVTTPGVKGNDLHDGKELTGAAVKEFRSAAMRAVYLAADRPELQFASKEVARAMQRPTTTAWEAIKRISRFLLGAPRVVWEWRRQSWRNDLTGYADSDWAGQPGSRKSTSCSTCCLGGHLISQSATTQGPIALSSGEAEFNALVKLCSRMLGMKSLALDLGFSLGLRLFTDSAAAKGICSRRGCGRVRHLETPLLWVQKALEERKFTLLKIDGKVNPADLGTKHLDGTTMLGHLSRLSCAIRGGRSQLALRAAV